MTEKRKPIPQGVRFNVLRRDNFACRYCGRGSPAVVLHLDHVKAHSAGGEDTEANLITACEACNFGKGAKADVTPPVVQPPAGDHGIVGWFGHTYDGDQVRYQFQILRQVAADLYAVQLFSWMSGEATDIEVWPLEDLRAPKAKLYADHGAWTAAYDVYARATYSREARDSRVRGLH